jgi:hypothetical protein
MAIRALRQHDRRVLVRGRRPQQRHVCQQPRLDQRVARLARGDTVTFD